MGWIGCVFVECSIDGWVDGQYLVQFICFGDLGDDWLVVYQMQVDVVVLILLCFVGQCGESVVVYEIEFGDVDDEWFGCCDVGGGFGD